MNKNLLYFIGIFLGLALLFPPSLSAQNAQITDNQAHEIILNGTPEDVRKLLDSGYNVNQVYMCNTPLITAIKSATFGLQKQITPAIALEKIKILVAAGADLNLVPCPGQGMSPLNWAIIQPSEFKTIGDMSVQAFNHMVQAGVGECTLPQIISKPCKDISGSEKEKVNQIIYAVYTEMGKQWTPLFMEIIDYLVENGADINGNSLNRNKVMPIHLATTNPQKVTLEPLKYLIEKGANLNIQDIEGNTPLFWAYGTQNDKAVNLLKKANADITIKNNKGQFYNEVMTKTIRGMFVNPN